MASISRSAGARVLRFEIIERWFLTVSLNTMVLDILLAISFIGSAGFLWYRISEKIPELVAIPDEVIVSRLREDSARVRVFLLQFRVFVRERRWREPCLRLCEKILHRFHIWLLRLDNTVALLLKKVRGLAGLANGNNNGASDAIPESADEGLMQVGGYWTHLKRGESQDAPTLEENSALRPRAPRAGRMQEVRMKKNARSPE